MTEDEARTKWCPFCSIGQFGENTITNRGDVIVSGESKVCDLFCCIGSSCMAWRYVEGFSPEETKQGDKTSGYCGLAGKL